MMPLQQTHPTLGEATTSTNLMTSTKKEKKTVSFKETITIVRFHDFGENTWHTIEDRKRFVLEARREALAWIHKGCYNFLLKDTFHDPSDASAQEKMNAYSQLGGDDYCRGLERHVCREHGLKRDSFKKGAIRAIVNEGRKRKERGMPIDQAWMQMGEISRKLSFLATRFAHRVGIADERVMRLGEDPTMVTKLREEEMINKLEKESTASPPSSSCPAHQERAGTHQQQITLGGTNSNKENDESNSNNVQRQNSQRSVTSVNGWCHGPRESCIKVHVPAEVANC